MSPDLLAIIRDIAIIVMAVMVTVAALTLTVIALKLFRPLRRGARNFEMASRLVLEVSSRVTGLVTMGSEIGIYLWELLSTFRNRKSDDPPVEDGKAT